MISSNIVFVLFGAVIDGIPDHRDIVLSKAEQAANKTMMICCSGCKGEQLVLDL